MAADAFILNNGDNSRTKGIGIKLWSRDLPGRDIAISENEEVFTSF